MDDSADDYAKNSLRKRKEEKRRNAVAKDFCDGMISLAVSWLYKAKE